MVGNNFLISLEFSDNDEQEPTTPNSRLIYSMSKRQAFVASHCVCGACLSCRVSFMGIQPVQHGTLNSIRSMSKKYIFDVLSHCDLFVTAAQRS